MASFDDVLMGNLRGFRRETGQPMDEPAIRASAIPEFEPKESISALRDKYNELVNESTRPEYRGFKVPTNMDESQTEAWFASIDAREDAREAREAEPFLTREPEDWESQFLEQIKALNIAASKEEQRFLQDPEARTEAYKKFAGEVYEDVKAGDPETIRNVADVTSLTDPTGVSDVVSATQSGRLAISDPEKRGSHLTDAAISGTAGGIQVLASAVGAAPLVGSLLSGARLKNILRGAESAETAAEAAEAAEAAADAPAPIFESVLERAALSLPDEPIPVDDVEGVLQSAARGLSGEELEIVPKKRKEGVVYADDLTESELDEISDQIKNQKENLPNLEYPFNATMGSPGGARTRNVEVIGHAGKDKVEVKLENGRTIQVPADGIYMGSDPLVAKKPQFLVDPSFERKGFAGAEISRSELDETKIPDFVAASKAAGKNSVTKEELIEHLENNKVQIQEVLLENKEIPVPEEIKKLETERSQLFDIVEDDVVELSKIMAPADPASQIPKYKNNPNHFIELFIDYTEPFFRIGSSKDGKLLQRNLPDDMSEIVSDLVSLGIDKHAGEWSAEDIQRILNARKSIDAKLNDPQYRKKVTEEYDQYDLNERSHPDYPISDFLDKHHNLEEVSSLLFEIRDLEKRHAALRKFQDSENHQKYFKVNDSYSLKYDVFSGDVRNAEPRWEFYTIPKGDNYREFVFAVPPPKPTKAEIQEYADNLELEQDPMDPDKLRLVNRNPDRAGLGAVISGRVKKLPDGRYEMPRRIVKDPATRRKVRFAEALVHDNLDDVKRDIALNYPGGLRDQNQRLYEFKEHHHLASGKLREIPNVVLHIRTKDRVDKKGRKILFVEEIQSDWHQKGRNRGYQGKPKKLPDDLESGLQRLIDADNNLKNIKDRYYKLLGGEGDFSFDEMDALEAQIKAADTELGAAQKNFAEAIKRNDPDGKFTSTPSVYASSMPPEPDEFKDRWNFMTTGGEPVPDAPFKDTKEWMTLAIRRIFREASDGGYDGVVFTRSDMITPLVAMGKRDAVDVIFTPNPAETIDERLRIMDRHDAEYIQRIFDGNKYIYDTLIPSIASKESGVKRSNTFVELDPDGTQYPGDSTSGFQSEHLFPFFEVTKDVKKKVSKPQKLYSVALPGIAIGAAAAEEEELSAAAALGALGLGGMALYKGAKGARAAKLEGLTDLKGNTPKLNDDGTITLYHRTTPEAAAEIRRTGKFVSKENTDEVFFSSKPTGQAEGYGSEVVEVRVDPANVRLDDAFDDEIHVAVKTADVPKPPAAAVGNKPLFAPAKDQQNKIWSNPERHPKPDDLVVVEHTTQPKYLDLFMDEGIDATIPPPSSGMGRLTKQPDGSVRQTSIGEPGLYVAPPETLTASQRVVIVTPAGSINRSLEAEGLGYESGIAGLYGAGDAIINSKIPPENVAGKFIYDRQDSKWKWIGNPKSPYADRFEADGSSLRTKPAPAPDAATAGAKAADDISARFPDASDVVDGRKVINADNVPNMSSIDSSLDDYEILPGIREVSMDEFPSLDGRHYSAQGTKRIKDLEQEIASTGEITPLIVVIDDDGPYILEGATRSEALYRAGAKSFPAKVVIDKSAKPPATDAAPAGAKGARAAKSPETGERFMDVVGTTPTSQMSTEDLLSEYGKMHRREFITSAPGVDSPYFVQWIEDAKENTPALKSRRRAVLTQIEENIYAKDGVPPKGQVAGKTYIHYTDADTADAFKSGDIEPEDFRVAPGFDPVTGERVGISGGEAALFLSLDNSHWKKAVSDYRGSAKAVPIRLLDNAEVLEIDSPESLIRVFQKIKVSPANRSEFFKAIEQEGYDAVVIRNVKDVIAMGPDIPGSDFWKFAEADQIVVLKKGNLSPVDVDQGRLQEFARTIDDATKRPTVEEGNPIQELSPMALSDRSYSPMDAIMVYTDEVSSAKQEFDRRTRIAAKYEPIFLNLMKMEAEYFDMPEGSEEANEISDRYESMLDDYSNIDQELLSDEFDRFIQGVDYYHETNEGSLSDFDVDRAFEVLDYRSSEIKMNIDLRRVQEATQQRRFNRMKSRGGTLVDLAGSNSSINRLIVEKAKTFDHPVQTVQLNESDKLELENDLKNIEELKEDGLISYLLYKELKGDVMLF